MLLAVVMASIRTGSEPFLRWFCSVRHNSALLQYFCNISYTGMDVKHAHTRGNNYSAPDLCLQRHISLSSCWYFRSFQRSSHWFCCSCWSLVLGNKTIFQQSSSTWPSPLLHRMLLELRATLARTDLTDFGETSGLFLLKCADTRTKWSKER